MGLSLIFLFLAAGGLWEALSQESPALRLFRRWLEVFNAGDRASLTRFLQSHRPSEAARVDEMLAFREETGGFELEKIERAEPFGVTGVVKEREGDNYARFELELEPGNPERIAGMSLRVLPPSPEFPGPGRVSDAEAVAALRSEINRRCARGQFSGAALVARRKKVLFAQACGLADRERGVPNRLTTRFRLGSMNKMFTAVAVMQLVQAGKLRLEDTVGRHLPGYPNREVAAKVTVRQLLTHTAGMGDIFGPAFQRERQNLRELRDYLRLYGSRAPEFEPGSRWAYSNYGYILLGVLIEAVSGESYYEYVRRHVFKPAGMEATDSLPEDVRVPERATGYMRRQGAWVPNTDTLPYRGTSAGGGYSTVRDLHRFALALLGHRLLDAEHTRLLTTPQMETPGGGRYAYGFGVGSEDGALWFGHGGGAPGMNGELRIFPESGHVLVALANLDPPAAGRVVSFAARRLRF